MERIKGRFLRSLLSENTEEHVLSLHFVSEETAEMRRRLDDTESSTFLPAIKWKTVKNTVIGWLKSDKSDEVFRAVMTQTAEWKNYVVPFGPYKVPIGIKYPMYGAKTECRRFVVVFIVHKYRGYNGKTEYDVRVKTVHPEK